LTGPREPPVVGVVGAGTMGTGIAQVALESGAHVFLHDIDPMAFERARARIADGLVRGARSRGQSGDDAAAEAVVGLARLEPSAGLDELGRTADLIIEAALEDLALKRRIFARLNAAAPPTAILATNTSALSVGAIAAGLPHPERVVGLHFFNPAPVMALVEVVASAGADPAVVDAAERLVVGWGKTAVRTADAPGFIVNRVNRPFTLEALRMLEDGLGTVESIDAAIRADGFPMGPFELMDLVGIDVNLAAARAIFEGFHYEPRFRPSAIQERLVEAGRLGRKAGEGFYWYGEDGRPLSMAGAFADDGAPPGVPLGAERRLPGGDAEPPGSPGLDPIVERIVLPIVNEAFLALGEGVARSAADIDLALRLGAGHPRGPFEQLDRLGGPPGVVARLERLAARAGPGGDRFAPAPLLLEAARGG
jgi:3-hydroxybutyryl-CoA dehydrogenase